MGWGWGWGERCITLKMKLKPGTTITTISELCSIPDKHAEEVGYYH